MLNFFVIADEDAKPTPAQLHDMPHVGEIDDKTFFHLMQLGIIDSRFNYYSDFRWSTDTIAQVFRKISGADNDDPCVEKLLTILIEAKSAKKGLIAVGD
ncbi:hypothetical protein [Persicobacter psychrovividus]|uniref:Uncharacterized protein n=1 Tax=Persicobacter psychrovividus TaxID=387638 RepID=A0ABN6LC91_9BACT|nr:hypothetical protein PEPS_31130 [Persicobacter psychrovividus]